jgi:phosphoribosylaminoimidazole carboxylase (NCAIR synthetase)
MTISEQLLIYYESAAKKIHHLINVLGEVEYRFERMVIMDLLTELQTLEAQVASQMAGLLQQQADAQAKLDALNVQIPNYQAVDADLLALIAKLTPVPPVP